MKIIFWRIIIRVGILSTILLVFYQFSDLIFDYCYLISFLFIIVLEVVPEDKLYMGMDSTEDSFKTPKIDNKFYFESRRLDGWSFNLENDAETKRLDEIKRTLESKKLSETSITEYSDTTGRINANIEYIKSKENNKDIVTFKFLEGNLEKTVKNESLSSSFPRNNNENFYYIPGDIPPSKDIPSLRPKGCYRAGIPKTLGENNIGKLTKDVLTLNGKDPLLIYKGRTLSIVRNYLDTKNASVMWGSEEFRVFRENIQKDGKFLPENSKVVINRLRDKEDRLGWDLDKELMKWGASKAEALEIRCFITREIQEKQIRQESHVFESFLEAVAAEKK